MIKRYNLISIEQWISFFLTLLATLFGVLMAIWLTNIQTEKKDRKDTIKLLNTAKIITETSKEYSQGLYQYIQKNQNNADIKNIKKTNPIPYPDFLEEIIFSFVYLRKIKS